MVLVRILNKNKGLIQYTVTVLQFKRQVSFLRFSNKIVTLELILFVSFDMFFRTFSLSLL